MRQALTVVALCVLSFAAGAIAMRIYDLGRQGGGSVAPSAATNLATNAVSAPATVDFTRQPLWAYGFIESPKPGEKASPQAAPSRNLRPNEDANEQTKTSPVARESGVVFSRRHSRRRECHRLVSRRSPGDARHHQARAGADEGRTTGLRLLPPAERPRTPGECAGLRVCRRRTSPSSSTTSATGCAAARTRASRTRTR